MGSCMTFELLHQRIIALAHDLTFRYERYPCCLIHLYRVERLEGTVLMFIEDLIILGTCCYIHCLYFGLIFEVCLYCHIIQVTMSVYILLYISSSTTPSIKYSSCSWGCLDINSALVAPAAGRSGPDARNWRCLVRR